MLVTSTVHEVAEALLPLADCRREIQCKKYTGGDFEFLGITKPCRRKATENLVRRRYASHDLISAAYALWDFPHREYQYVALDLLDTHSGKLSLDHVEEILLLSQKSPWWDTVDEMARIVGDILRVERRTNPEAQQVMDRAVEHHNMWVRRLAMLHQLGWRGQTDVDRLFAYAIKLACEAEPFIQKAIGRALRNYAKHDPAAVRDFLSASGSAFSLQTMREATKYF